MLLICSFLFLSNFSAKNLLINSNQAHQIAAHPVHHLSMQMGLPDDNPNTFGDHYGFGCSTGAGLEGLASCWQEEDLPICSFLFLSNFSVKNLLINSHQAHQITAQPVHHLPMDLPDDNPGSFWDHYGFGCHAGPKELASSWQEDSLISSLLFLSNLL
jgi:hypothetical protein